MHPEIPPLELPPDWRAHAPRTARQRWTWWGNALLMVAAVVLIVIATMRITEMIARRPAHVDAARALSAIPTFIGIMAAVVAMLILHELGHVAGGLLAGWRLQSLFVGPVRLMREDDRLHVYWHRIFPLYGGAALVVPRRWAEPAAQRGARILYVAGGPVTSLVAGLLLVAGLRASGVAARDMFRSAQAIIITTAGLASLAMGIGTLVPIRPGPGLRSDGLQLLALLRASQSPGRAWEPDPETLTALIQVQLLQQRPRDWERALVEQIDRMPAANRHTLRYFHALDRGDVAAAREHLQLALNAIAASTTRTGGIQRRSLAIEAACFEAAWREDVAASLAWSDRGGPPRFVDEHGACIADAARALARDDVPAARRQLERARWAVRRTALLRLDLVRAATIDRLAARGES